MIDYEEKILARQETNGDSCRNCEHKTNCKNQCEKITYGRRIEEIYPQLFYNRLENNNRL